MNKNELLDAIQEFVTIIIAHDNAKYNNNSYSIEFDNDIQKVNVPNNGYIKSIDTNNFVTIQFSDCVTTTDWLPLAILDSNIIRDIYNVLLEMNSIVNSDKVYVLQCDWVMDEIDRGHDTIGVFKNKEKLHCAFKKFILNEVNSGSWIADFVDTDGNIVDECNEPEEYTFLCDKPYFSILDGDKKVEVYVDEMFII